MLERHELGQSALDVFNEGFLKTAGTTSLALVSPVGTGAKRVWNQWDATKDLAELPEQREALRDTIRDKLQQLDDALAQYEVEIAIANEWLVTIEAVKKASIAISGGTARIERAFPPD